MCGSGGVLAVLVSVLGVVAASAGGPDGGYGPPIAPRCYPKVHFITKYENVVQEIPVPNKVFKTQLITSTQYLTNVQQVYQDVILTHYLPKFITTTVVVPQLKYVTDYKINYETDYQPVYVTKKEVLPKYVTQTHYDNIIKTKVVYDTVHETKVVPQYSTTYLQVYKTIVDTQFVPQIHTVVNTKYYTSTICPDKGY